MEKRHTILSVFDTLGVLVLILLLAQLVLQELWRLGTRWDEPIDDIMKTTEVQLHQFCDALKLAFGAKA